MKIITKSKLMYNGSLYFKGKDYAIKDGVLDASKEVIDGILASKFKNKFLLELADPKTTFVPNSEQSEQEIAYAKSSWTTEKIQEFADEIGFKIPGTATTKALMCDEINAFVDKKEV